MHETHPLFCSLFFGRNERNETQEVMEAELICVEDVIEERPALEGGPHRYLMETSIR